MAMGLFRGKAIWNNPFLYNGALKMKRLYQFILVVTALLLFVTGLTAGCRNEVNVSGQGSKTETNVKTANKIDDDKAAAEKKIQEEERIKAEAEKAKKETLENAEREKVQIKQKAGNLQYYVFVKRALLRYT